MAAGLLALLFLVAPLRTGWADDAPRHGGRLVYGIESEIPWMDPHIVFGGSNKRVVMTVFEGLVERDRTQPGQTPPLAPALATSWTVSPDGLTYTFTLRQGVNFHDGTPFNADAVVFNFRRIIDPDFQFYDKRTAPLRGAPLRYLKEVKAIDDHTVQLILSRPWGPFLDQLSTTLSSGLPLIMSPESVRQYGNEGANLHPAGTGPFKVASYDPGVKTVLQRNSSYWKQPEPYLDEIDFLVIPEETTRVTALESGSVDMITALPPDRIAPLRSAGFNIVQPGAMNLVWFFSINMQDPAMQDVRVRQAINYAIDREGMAKDLLAGAVVPTSVMLPRTSPLWDAKFANTYPYDPDKAKALLKEAGVADGLTAKLQLPAGGSYMITPVPMAEAVQRDLAAVGIKLQLQTFDWVTYLGYWVKGMAPDVAMNTMAWGTDYSEWWAADVFMSKAFGNSGRINDPAVDKLFADYAAATKQADADAIARKVFERVTEQAYFVPICSDLAPIATAAKVKGVIPIPDWMQDFRRIWIAQ